MPHVRFAFSLRSASLLPLLLAFSAAGAPAAPPGGERPQRWMLAPRVFHRLSSAGQRAALRLNGRLPLPRPESERPRAARPAPLPAAGSSPFPNVRVNDPSLDRVGRTQSETSVAVDGPHVVVGFNDLGADEGSTGYGFSLDSGGTFTHRRLPSAPGSVHIGDPSVAAGANGTFYFASLVLDSAPTGGYLSRVGVSRSDDHGATFSTPAFASTAVEEPSRFQDKEWIAADASPASPHRGNVYVAWTTFGAPPAFTQIAFTRSRDGGRTFDAARFLTPSDPPYFDVQGASMAVAPNGDLFVAWLSESDAPIGGVCCPYHQIIVVARSTDGGATFGPRSVAASFDAVPYLATGGNGVRVNSFPSVAVGPSGTVHVVYASLGSRDLPDRGDVSYVRSANGGAAFSAPVQLNRDHTVTTQSIPWVAVAADGTVGAAWWDRSVDPAHDSLTGVTMALSKDDGLSFSEGFRVTDGNGAFGPTEYVAQGYHGDYNQLVAAGNAFRLSWSDERGEDADAYTASVPSSYAPDTPDFEIAAGTPFVMLAAGTSVDVPFRTSGLFGFAAPLAVGCRSALPEISCAAATVTAGAGGALTLSVSASAPPGAYVVPLEAGAGGALRRSKVVVDVLPRDYPARIPVNVSGSRGFTATSRTLVVDRRGAIHLVYADDEGSENFPYRDVYRLRYRRSTDGGRTFSVPLAISTNDWYGLDGTLVADADGRLFLFYTTYDVPVSGTYSRVWLARSTDGGESFSAPAAVTPGESSCGAASAAVDGASGAILLSFGCSDADLSKPSTFSAVFSTDHGLTFTPPVPLVQGEFLLSLPRAAFGPDGAAYFAYSGATDPVAPLYQVKLRKAADGRAFAPAVTLSGGTVHAFAPDLAFDADGRLHLAFSYVFFLPPDGEVSRRTAFTTSTDAGATFAPIRLLSSHGVQARDAILLPGPGGRLAVAWSQTRDFAATSRSEARAPEEEDGDAEEPGFFRLRGAAVGDGSPNPDVLLTVSTDHGAAFGPPMNLSSDPGLSTALAAGVAPDGALVLAWTDDSSANAEALLSVVPPAAFTPPPPPQLSAPGTLIAGDAIAFGVGVSGDVVSWRWDFGDGSTREGAGPDPSVGLPHHFARPGTYVVTLTVRNALGAGSTTSRTVQVTEKTIPSGLGAVRLLPVAVDAEGLAGSRFRTDVVLASRAVVATGVSLRFTPSSGVGGGVARITLAPGETRQLPEVIDFLRTRSLGIPADAAAAGTLLVTFEDLPTDADVFAGARTWTAAPSGALGTCGVFYRARPPVPAGDALLVAGLRQDDLLRSNLGLVNAGPDPVTLRITLRGSDGAVVGVLPDVSLAGWGWRQITAPLASLAAAGSALVTRVGGSGPFTAYGVLNDAVTSDGAFLEPVVPDEAGSASATSRLVPVVVDVTGVAGTRYRSELTLVNLGASPLALRLAFTAGDVTSSAGVTLSSGETRVLPDAVAFLRGLGMSLPPDGQVAGALRLDASGPFVAEVRTFAPAATGGTYGVAYGAGTLVEAAADEAYVDGLVLNSDTRTNVGLASWGDAGDPIGLSITFYSESGAPLGPAQEMTLRPGEWRQLDDPLHAFVATGGYARIRRTSGRSHFVAYGVAVDAFTQDGSFVEMTAP